MRRRLKIDWTRCDAHGLCATLLPEKITLDEFGFPMIDPAGRASRAALRRAVASCPALALRLERGLGSERADQPELTRARTSRRDATPSLASTATRDDRLS